MLLSGKVTKISRLGEPLFLGGGGGEWGYERIQDLVFSVKLRFGKTLVLVQNEFEFKEVFKSKIFCFKMFGLKEYISSKKNFGFGKFLVKRKGLLHLVLVGDEIVLRCLIP